MRSGEACFLNVKKYKNTAHIERCLLNNSYLCSVTENPSQT